MTQVPPAVLDYERAVLGGVLLDGRPALERVLGILSPNDFYTEAHRTVYRGMLSCYEQGKPIDALTLQEELRGEALRLAGGPTTLALLIEQGATAAYLDTYADGIVAKANLRGVIQAAGHAVAEAFNDEKSPEEIVSGLMSKLEALARRRHRVEYDPAVNWQRLVDGWGAGAVEVGMPALDSLTGGLTRGQLLAVAGRTSTGKTAFTWDRALAVAAAGRHVEIISLEEHADAATRRAVGNLGNVPIKKLRDGQLHQGEFERAEEAVRELQKLPIRIRDARDVGSSDENAVIGAVALSPAEVVIVDHLQKIEPRAGGKGEPRTYAIGRMMNRLEAIALRDSKVIWVNVQLSRESDPKRAPMLADIRDSASIENTARQVWLLHWPWKADEGKLPTDYEVYVAKNSEGPTGRVPLTFRASVGRFTGRDENGE